MLVNPVSRAAPAAVLLALMLGCAAEPAAPRLSHDRDLQPLWDAKCADCHMGTQAFGGLFLDPGHAYENLVGVPASQLPTMVRIRAGDPKRSYVWLKLKGTHLEAGGYGEPIPVVLTDLEEARILGWIEQGAPR
ncbi:MAG: hypothetical protein ACRBN8_45315 [Nannocystales bacterium]